MAYKQEYSKDIFYTYCMKLKFTRLLYFINENIFTVSINLGH